MNEHPPLPSQQEQPAELEKPSIALRRAHAFQAVFGQPDNRSADQRIVMEHLRAMCGRDVAVFQADRNGNFDPLRAAHIDGAQTQYLIIKRQLAVARRAAEKDKPKPKTKR